MSIELERCTMALHRMVYEMNRKGIEQSRITKCATQLLMSGVSQNSISTEIVQKCIETQNNDGGWVAVVDTIWNAKFLSFFSKTNENIVHAYRYLNDNKVDFGFGRSKRDIGRIPVTGIAYYLHPQLATLDGLRWLENLWISEKNGLTYKAAYTLMAFKRTNYKPLNIGVIEEAVLWLLSQQEKDGGFSPWKHHPVGTNVYCTALSLIGLLQYNEFIPQANAAIEAAYQYIYKNQLINGLWPYHELEDGGAWGMQAMFQYESEYAHEF